MVVASNEDGVVTGDDVIAAANVAVVGAVGVDEGVVAANAGVVVGVVAGDDIAVIVDKVDGEDAGESDGKGAVFSGTTGCCCCW